MSENPLTCEEVVQQLFTYLDGDVDDARSVEIDRHLEACRECCSRLEFEKRLRKKIQGSGTQQAPERLYRRVRRILDQS